MLTQTITDRLLDVLPQIEMSDERPQMAVEVVLGRRRDPVI